MIKRAQAAVIVITPEQRQVLDQWVRRPKISTGVGFAGADRFAIG